MTAVIQRIAWIAKGLTKAELHVLVELSARVDRKNGFDISASSRELADKTGLARASVQTAIDTLNEKQSEFPASLRGCGLKNLLASAGG